MTREDDGICNPCASLISLFEMKRADAAADEAREIARAHHPSNRKMAEED